MLNIPATRYSGHQNNKPLNPTVIRVRKPGDIATFQRWQNTKTILCLTVGVQR